jgi:hypothetical protein
MTDYDLPNGLSLLADEAEPAPIDTYDVIAKAKARTRNRRTSAAAAVGTVAVVGALAVTLGFPNADQGGTGVATQTSTVTPDCPNGVCELPGPAAPSAAQGEIFDEQLAAAIDTLIPAGFTLERDPASTETPLSFVGTTGQSGPVYTAQAWLRDAQGPASLTVFVLKNPAGTPLAHMNGQFFGPCQQGEPNCEIRTLPDGTQATAQANARPPGLQLSSTLSAQRPDGTYIQVITSVGISSVPGGEQARPEPPMNNEDLFKWATVFTWGESDLGYEPAKYDGQLADAGGIPSRYTVEGAGGVNPAAFQEAPDGSDTPRYFVQATLVADGERTPFSIWVMKKEDADGDSGRCGDDANCTEHQLSGDTSAAIRTSERSDETTLMLSALRPDGTVIRVQHSGDPNSKLMTESELLKYATAFSY